MKRKETKSDAVAQRRVLRARMSSATGASVRTAFIAMPMCREDPRLEDILDAIKEGARDAGVTAFRIDEDVSNAPTMKRVFEAIETCEVVIAELTFGRFNVGYEAGLAEGMGKTPIYLAASPGDIPYDLSDYPVIVYRNLRSLKQLLKQRLLRS